ncbi:hypothetical protein JKF63_00707 [Porcisia hertigi]|uniref:Peptidase C51 domain-containing protein n=1 Tax=Porcisia hertigi TaxID=2761500 RepID=A0A836GYT0_9TRYP|nr:hypothetical protein JKF63_00707 [Porcisia hertigi]
MASHAGSAVSPLPYGAYQGSFRGVVACSNRDDGYFSGENNYVNMLIYTGFRYQCVEYARRFLLLTTGCLFDSCGRASEIYAMNHITHVETGAQYALHHHHNDGTATQRPEPGDVIIYPYHPKMTPWGHVGIISFVDDGRVGIAEQNQHFGSFVSPDESYLNGERCVARYATLHHDQVTNTWRIEEPGTLPRALGWMSYPDAPTREKIHAPLKPLPHAIKARSTPFDQHDHPFFTHYHLRSGFDIPSGSVEHLYGLRSGAKEALVGATSAVARVLRFTLQLFFNRCRLGPVFRALPANSLSAHPPETADACIESCPELDALFRVLAQEDVIDATESTPDHLRQALASYFNIPIEWIMSMEREFAKGEAHMAAVVSFYPNISTDLVDVEAFRAARRSWNTEAASAVEKLSLAPTQTGTRIPDGATAATPPVTIEELPFKNPHDEAWCLAGVNFGNARIMTELSHLNGIQPQMTEALALMDPSVRCHTSAQYSTDFAGYLKFVETVYGPRTAFTIVLSDEHPMDGLLRKMVTIVQNLCDRVKHPIRVVNEKDLVFVDGRLQIASTEASPMADTTPSEAQDVNFVYMLCEWSCVLENRETNHAALYSAAVDPASDVVFAKPLWSYLCTGALNVDDAERTSHTHSRSSASVRFFDVCRRLYRLASPKPPAEMRDLEVLEYIDSCRRIHIDAETVPVYSPVDLRSDSLMINFAWSCSMGHVGGALQVDAENTGADPGHPASLFFMFSTDV